jgi:hypothetical protein
VPSHGNTGGNKARFDEMQYSDLVLLVKRVDQAVITLLALDAWSTKTMALQAMVGQMWRNLIQLCNKAVAPLVGMYNYVRL